MIPRTVVRGRKNPLHFRFAARLKKARKAIGQTRFGLTTKSAALDRELVASLERGERLPRLDTVEKVAYALDLSPAFLAYGIEGECPALLDLRAGGVGARLRAVRSARGLSVLALATAAGVSHTAVGNIERGTMPNIATAEALAHALGCSPAWLAYAVGPELLPSRRAARRTSADHAAE